MWRLPCSQSMIYPTSVVQAEVGNTFQKGQETEGSWSAEPRREQTQRQSWAVHGPLWWRQGREGRRWCLDRQNRSRLWRGHRTEGSESGELGDGQPLALRRMDRRRQTIANDALFHYFLFLALSFLTLSLLMVASPLRTGRVPRSEGGNESHDPEKKMISAMHNACAVDALPNSCHFVG